MAVVGRIVEKGFSSGGDFANADIVSAPQPKVTPFPVARHRSEGPHWAPAVKEVFEPPEDRDEEDEEQVDAQNLADFAQPLLRRKKESSQFRKFRTSAGPVQAGRGLQLSAAPYDAGKIDAPAQLSGQSLIDGENRLALLSMSASQVVEAQEELKSRFRPEILEMLKKRGADKESKIREARQDCSDGSLPQATAERSSGSLQGRVSESNVAQPEVCEDVETDTGLAARSWTQRVEAVRLMKFGLKGDVIAAEDCDPADPDTIRELKGSAQRVAERDILRSEGDPAGLGYSILETIALARSTIPGQRAVALRLLCSVLNRAMEELENEKLVDDSHSRSELVDWQAVWAYALGPEPEVVLTLRIALDDTHTTVIAACAKALQALLSCCANERFFRIHEVTWHGERPMFTAPVFQRHTKQDEGFIGGGRWKYNVKPSEMSHSTNSQGNPEHGNDTVGDDATVANKDVAAGLIRMGVLPRIRFILEVEKNVAAEEALLDVVTALARHSPSGAEAVMKCPRLMDTIIQQFLASDESLDVGIRPAHTKAIQLLKVLSQASRSSCVTFAESGALQVAQSELFRQAYLLSARSKVGQQYSPGLCSTLIEALRLWRVCISYQIGVSLFSDFYPALCFWVAPYSEDEFNTGDSEAFRLTQESFVLLEKIAETLPVMHLDGGTAAAVDETSIHTSWSWAVAVPLVKAALDWLSPDRMIALLAQLEEQEGQTGRASTREHKKNILGALASVLHFLSTVCTRVLPLMDFSEVGPIAHSHRPSAPWLPTFVPELGLAMVNGNLLNFQDADAQEQASEEGHTFVEVLSSLRDGLYDETSVIASSCLLGIVRLVKVIDHLITEAKPEASSVQPETSSPSRAHDILTRGLAVSAKNDLQHLLTTLGNEVIRNQEFLVSSAINGRAGPAPGVGLGWASLGGGMWSRRYLSAKVTAMIVMDLLQTVAHEKDQAGLFWRIQVGLGIALVAGPGEGSFLTKIFDTVVLDKTIFEAMSDNVLCATKQWKQIHGDMGPTEPLQVDVSSIIKSLSRHFRETWLSRKMRKAVKNTPASTPGKKSIVASKLTRIDEENLMPRDEVLTELGREWSGQRLPLPAHWFLSSVSAAAVVQDGKREMLESQCVEANPAGLGESDQKIQRLKEVIKSGLLFLLGLELIVGRKLGAAQFQVLKKTNLVRKVHAISTIFVSGCDIFLEGLPRALIAILQEIYGLQLDGPTFLQEIVTNVRAGLPSTAEIPPSEDNESLDFNLIDGAYTQFAESLADNFAAESYGDIVFARQVTLYLQRDVPDSIRLAVWQVLSEAQVLHLLPPFKLCAGQQRTYFYPPESNEKILDAYLCAWSAGLLDKAAALGSMSFFLALHHIALFIFGEEGKTDEHLLLRKKSAKTLLRSATRKPSQQGLLLQLISYQAANPSAPWAFLYEASDGDEGLLAQLTKLKNQLAG